MLTCLVVVAFVVSMREASRRPEFRWYVPAEFPRARVWGGTLARPRLLAAPALERCARCHRPTSAALSEPRARDLPMIREVCTCAPPTGS